MESCYPFLLPLLETSYTLTVFSFAHLNLMDLRGGMSSRASSQSADDDVTSCWLIKRQKLSSFMHSGFIWAEVQNPQISFLRRATRRSETSLLKTEVWFLLLDVSFSELLLPRSVHGGWDESSFSSVHSQRSERKRPKAEVKSKCGKNRRNVKRSESEIWV